MLLLVGCDCFRCGRTFQSNAAYKQHLRDSSRHNPCPECNFDGHSWDALLDHCEEEECRIVCRGCRGGDGYHWHRDGDGYWDHVYEKNVCTVCDRHFESDANLHHHKLIHREAGIECLRCDRMFKTYGGMVIHLESGACEAQIYVTDVNKTAAKCNRWKEFIDACYHDDMIRARNISEPYDNSNPFKCPACGTAFPKLSSLFQHCESQACEQDLDSGAIRQLRRYLARAL